jgi:Holliday junction resolvase RusA-like endonuclease
MEINLTFNIRPIPHQSVRFGKQGYSYTPKRVVDYKKNIVTLTKKQLPKNFDMIKSGTPITIEYLHYIFKHPSNFSKKKREVFTFRTARPDLTDNINKALMDALEGVIFEKDENIVHVKDLKKYYGPEDMIKIKLSYD